MSTFNGYFLNSTPANIPAWFGSISGIDAINFNGSWLALFNSDGTETVLHGDLFGFSIDSSGMIHGTIRWITHTTQRTFGTFDAFEFDAVGDIADHINVDATAFFSGDAQTRFDLVFNRAGMVFNGTAGGDVLASGSGADQFFGKGGIDTVSYSFAAGSITIDLAASSSTWLGEAAGDNFNSIEIIEGSNNGLGDVLLGDGGDNIIRGLGSHDFINGRGGADTLDGGDGNDVLVGGLGDDTLNGGSGRDEINYVGVNQNLYISLQNGDGMVVTLTNLGHDDFTSIENVHTGNGNDQIDGSNDANSLYGDNGNDKLIGYYGNDELFGGAGNDTMEGGDGADTVHGGGGIDTIQFYNLNFWGVTVSLDETGSGIAYSGAGNDTFDGITNIVGTQENDVIGGNSAANWLYGSGGGDTIYGGSGNDIIEGGDWADNLFGDNDWGVQDGNQAWGDDAISGDGGNDIFNGGNGNDTFTGGSESDTATYRGLFDDFGNTEYFIVADLSIDKVFKFSVDLFDSTVSAYGIDTVYGGGAGATENLRGTLGNDQITDGAASGWFYGDQGDDVFEIMNDGLFDGFNGEGGQDKIMMNRATSGVTVIMSPQGQQTVTGGGLGETWVRGMETMTLSGYNDSVILGNADSTPIKIFAVGGDDILQASTAINIFDGGNGADTINYFASDAAVNVNLKTNAVAGGYANGDVLTGFENVIGSRWNDVLTGGSGRSVLTGGWGQDMLRGGRGADTFVYTQVFDSQDGSIGYDTIADFCVDGNDRIDLRQIDAIEGNAVANDVFTYFTGNSFTQAGQVRVTALLSGNYLVEANTNADLGADITILLRKPGLFDASNFLL